MKQAAAGLKRVHLELGGKSPAIIFPDADLDRAANAAAWGVFWRCGQICTAASRLLVHRSIHDQLLERLQRIAAGMRVGHPSDAGTVLGPLISHEHLQRVDALVQGARRDGARLVLGGEPLRDPDLAGGCYYPPTIFADLDPASTLAQVEVFGPVVGLIPFDDEDHAVRIAYDTMYGLASAVWTEHLGTAMRVARRLRAGTVWINDYGLVHAEMPVGGYKQSGFGRELGVEGMAEYQQTKSIHVRM